MAGMNVTPIPRLPVCYKAGIASYPCDSLPKLRENGNWLCDEHYFQAQQARLQKSKE